MNNYYTIISAIIRPEINEKISLGLLTVCENEVSLNISKTKLSIAKSLLPRHLFIGLKDEIKSVQLTCERLKKGEFYKNQLKSLVGEDYISYLSRYKNNIIGFSKPKKININLTDEIIKKLYNKYIDEQPFILENNIYKNSIEKYKKEYLPKLSPYYNTHRLVGRKIIPDIITPIKFDLVGKNKIEVFAKSIDLERRTYNVEYDVNGFYPLKNLKKEAKKFFISKEPDKKYEMQHQIWENLRSASWLDYVDISEVERLEEYAKEHHVQPLFSNE